MDENNTLVIMCQLMTPAGMGVGGSQNQLVIHQITNEAHQSKTFS